MIWNWLMNQLNWGINSSRYTGVTIVRYSHFLRVYLLEGYIFEKFHDFLIYILILTPNLTFRRYFAWCVPSLPAWIENNRWFRNRLCTTSRRYLKNINSKKMCKIYTVNIFIRTNKKGRVINLPNVHYEQPLAVWKKILNLRMIILYL